MQQRAREKHDLVLLRHNALIAAGTDLQPTFPLRIVQAQLPALKLPRFAGKKVNEGDPPRRDDFFRVITMRPEKVPVIAGCNLSFNLCDRELLHPKLIQHSRQHAPDSVKNNFLMLSQIHQHPRTAMVVIDHSGFSAGRDQLAALELRLALQGIGNKFLKLLRSQELVKDDTLRPNHLRRIQNTHAAG